MNKYIAEDGLVRLDLDDRREPFAPQFPPTVKNENGIVFRAELLHQLKMNGESISRFKDQSLRVLARLTKKTGITHRRPGQVDMTNSHDNKVGELVLMQLHGEWRMIRDSYRNLRNRFWIYNNTNRWGIKEICETWMLPRERALYRIANNKFPGIIAFIWLYFSVHTKSKEKRILRLRMASLQMSAALHRSWSANFLYARYKKWWDEWGGIVRYSKELESYYLDPNHPTRKLVSIAAIKFSLNSPKL